MVWVQCTVWCALLAGGAGKAHWKAPRAFTRCVCVCARECVMCLLCVGVWGWVYAWGGVHSAMHVCVCVHQAGYSSYAKLVDEMVCQRLVQVV